MTKFDGTEYLSKIERINDEHLKAGKRWYMSHEFVPIQDGPTMYKITLTSEIYGSVSWLEPLTGDIEDVHDRAVFKALSLFGY